MHRAPRPPYRLWRGAELPAWVERGGQNPRELGELKWDQRWRCALWTAGMGSCAALVAINKNVSALQHQLLVKNVSQRAAAPVLVR